MMRAVPVRHHLFSPDYAMPQLATPPDANAFCTDVPETFIFNLVISAISLCFFLMYLVISLLGHLAAETLKFATLIPSYTQIWCLTRRIFVLFCLDLQSRHAIGAINVWAVGVRISVGRDFKSSNRAVKGRLIMLLTAFLLGVFWVGAFIFGASWVVVWVLSKCYNFLPQSKNMQNRL